MNDGFQAVLEEMDMQSRYANHELGELSIDFMWFLPLAFSR